LHIEELLTTKLEAHITTQKAYRELYYANRWLSEKQSKSILTIIHDKIDQAKTTFSHFPHKNKLVDSIMKLPVAIKVWLLMVMELSICPLQIGNIS
jgi:hypothetical protein